ncbi:hypothetical protein SAY87_015472 [Trapa incisa]|uniref:Uncharacterized protein n=1 Tax=Trapa incisa TaxID=236973 RepID=A0AAN7GLQ6_9MYRT|nr:hypothetical protein SAY87_015472 [Trapa incisa]
MLGYGLCLKREGNVGTVGTGTTPPPQFFLLLYNFPLRPCRFHFFIIIIPHTYTHEVSVIVSIACPLIQRSHSARAGEDLGRWEVGLWGAIEKMMNKRGNQIPT